MILNQDQKQRYLRNLIMPEIGESGQIKLLQSKVLVIGAGGLGSAAIYYLAAAGVGKIGIADHDLVELSNLQRQIIHNHQDLGNSKVSSAAAKINLLNPDVKVVSHSLWIDQPSLSKLLKNYDWVVDASDNFATRFVINQACHRAKKPLIFAAVRGFSAQITTLKSYLPGNPCYACFNPNLDSAKLDLPLAEKGILGSVAGLAGTIQATVTIKEILGIEATLVGKMLICDLIKNDFRQVSFKKRPNCSVCSL